MSLSVRFNGVELNQYIDVVQGFTPLVGANWEPDALAIDGIPRGSDFSYTTYKGKQISMPFRMKYNLQGKYDELEKILNVDGLKELVFGCIPDRVFYAVPTGTLDFEEIAFLGKGTITWLIPDGLAHSIVEKTFDAAVNAQGVLEATIVNGGTESVPIDYTITHRHENGYIGIVSENGVIQLGNASEVDAETRQKSEVLIDYKNPADMSVMIDGDGVLTENFPTNGTFKTVNLVGKNWLALDNVGSGSSWHGASKTVTLPPDSSGEVGAVNFLAQTKIWFETGHVPQTGLLEFVLGDEDGQHLASIHVIKSTTNNNVASVVMQIQWAERHRIHYEPNKWERTTQNGGQMYIRKSGELFEFSFVGSLFQCRVPELAAKKAKSLTVFLGQWGTRGAGNLVTRMYFDYLTFRKDNVNYLYDVPNRYRAGSVVYVDGKATKIYTDGVPTQDDERVGTDYFKAPPGETKVQFYYSGFSVPGPTATAKIREAYL